MTRWLVGWLSYALALVWAAAWQVSLWLLFLPLFLAALRRTRR